MGKYLLLLLLFISTSTSSNTFDSQVISSEIIEHDEDDVLIWQTVKEIEIEYYEVTLISKDTIILDRILVDHDSYNIKTYKNIYNKPDIQNYYYRIDAVNYNGKIDNSFYLFAKNRNKFYTKF